MPDNLALAGGLESEDLSFRQAIRVVRKRKYVVLWLALVCGFLALVISSILRPYYSTTATIEIEKQQSDPMDSALGQLAGSLGGSDDTKTEIQTQVSVLQSDALAIRSMERTHYEDHQKHGWSLFGSNGRLPQERGLPLSEASVARESLLKQFSSHLTTIPILETPV